MSYGASRALLREVYLLPSTRRYVELQRRSIAREFSNASESLTSSRESPLRLSQTLFPVRSKRQRDRLLHHI